MFDVVYVKTKAFNPANNQLIVPILDEINRKFHEARKYYILIGPGRWGSQDPWLGIPVKWSNISSARVIVEKGRNNFV